MSMHTDPQKIRPLQIYFDAMYSQLSIHLSQRLYKRWANRMQQHSHVPSPSVAERMIMVTLDALPDRAFLYLKPQAIEETVTSLTDIAKAIAKFFFRGFRRAVRMVRKIRQRTRVLFNAIPTAKTKLP